MNVERIEDTVLSASDPDGLLALIVRHGPMEPGVRFVTGPECAHQVAAIRHPPGHVILPHRHKTHHREFWTTQEVLVIMRGRLAVSFYNTDGYEVCTHEVGPGDVLILLQGGHGMSVLEEIELYEVKLGPYPGRDMDKVGL